jgi:hypothetical protein
MSEVQVASREILAEFEGRPGDDFRKTPVVLRSRLHAAYPEYKQAH